MQKYFPFIKSKKQRKTILMWLYLVLETNLLNALKYLLDKKLYIGCI